MSRATDIEGGGFCLILPRAFSLSRSLVSILVGRCRSDAAPAAIDADVEIRRVGVLLGKLVLLQARGPVLECHGGARNGGGEEEEAGATTGNGGHR